MGCISALGRNVQTTWAALREGKSAIHELEGFEDTDIKVATAAQVSNYHPEEHFEPPQISLLDRHCQFALIAAREAAVDAALDTKELNDFAVVIGTGSGPKETEELSYQQLYKEHKRRLHPFTILRGMPSAASGQVSMDLGIRGPSFSLTSACSSTNHAIAQATLLIRTGVVDAAVAGGTDASITYGMLKSWEALRVLSPETCRPFSADRKGLVLGEGAGMFVLESLEHAKARGARIHALINGFGMSSDASHITNPSSDGAASAIQAALSDAGIPPESISYVNAHGTGTLLNDITETQAIKKVFGDHANRLLISSTKSMHGHALGASGAMELVATVRSLQESIIPPTANFSKASEGCDLNYVPNEPAIMSYEYAISNSFAFGGLNAVLVIGKNS